MALAAATATLIKLLCEGKTFAFRRSGFIASPPNFEFKPPITQRPFTE